MNRKTGVILSYVLMIFEVLSTLLLTPFIIRTLGQSEFGIYKLSAALSSYILLLDLGLGNAIIKYSAQYRFNNDLDNGRRFVGIATIYYSIVAALAIIVGLFLIALFPSVFAVGLSGEEIALGQKLLGITVINAAISLGTACFPNLLLAYEKYTVSKGTSIILIIFRMALTFFILKLGFRSLGIVLVNLIITILTRSIYVYYAFVKLKLWPQFKGIDWPFVKEIVSYSSLILLQMVATQINSTVDQVLIGAVVSSSATILAIYGLGIQIVQYFQSMGTAFSGVLMAGVVKMVNNNPEPHYITKEMVRVGRIIFMVLGVIFVGFLTVGHDFLKLWAGSDYLQAYYVTAVLMFVYLFIYTEAIGSQILWAMNKHKEQSIAKFFIVVSNILLTILLIKWTPLLGATIGTFISLLFGDIVVLNVIFVKKMGFEIFYYYKELCRGIVPCLIITAIVGFIINEFIECGWILLMCKIIIILLVYGISMISFGMNQYEKRLLTDPINKFLH